MKQLPFNEEKVLKALMKQTKVTTMRKAWKEKIIEKYGENCGLAKKVEKPCKYKVGDVVELIWTGDKNLILSAVLIPVKDFLPQVEMDKDMNPIKIVIGKAKVTKIEKIKLGMDQDLLYNCGGYIVQEIIETGDIMGDTRAKTLKPIAKAEGFESVEEMFEFLENYSGGLETAKPFWLIHYEYIK